MTLMRQVKDSRAPESPQEITTAALGTPGSRSAALKIGRVIMFLLMMVTISYSAPRPPRQRSSRQNRRMLRIINTRNRQRARPRRKGSVWASEDEICRLALINNHECGFYFKITPLAKLRMGVWLYLPQRGKGLWHRSFFF